MASQKVEDGGKILIVEDEESVADVMEMYIETEFDNEIIFAKSGNEAIEILKKDHDIVLVLSDYTMEDGNGRVLYRFLKESSLDPAFILVCAEDNIDPADMPEFMELFENRSELPFLTKPFNKEELVKIVSDFLKTKIELLSESYSPISADRFLIFKEMPVQAFMKMTGLGKYLPVFNKGAEVHEEDFKKYIDKGIQYLFIKKEEYEEFIKVSNEHLGLKLGVEASDSEENKSKLEEQVFLQFHSIEGIHRALRDLGIKETTIELADRFYKTILSNLKRSPKMASILGKLVTKKNYLYQLGILTSYLSVAILEKTEINNNENSERLVTASICQDISLDNTELAKIVDIENQSFKDLPFDTKEQVLTHPIRSAQLLVDQGIFSSETANIIREHHERPDGTGFPRNLDSSNLGELSCIFIIAHHFSHRLLTEPLSADTLGSINNELKEKFSQGNFEKPYEGFIQSFKS